MVILVSILALEFRALELEYVELFFSFTRYRYGEDVKQLITLSIKQHTPLSIAVDITLIISVLFTYPLQCYPVITLLEKYLLALGKSVSKLIYPVLLLGVLAITSLNCHRKMCLMFECIRIS